MRLVLAAAVALAGMSACDRNDPAPVPAADQRKADDTTYRLEAEANQIADDIAKLDAKISEVEKTAPTPSSTADEIAEYKQQLEHLNAEKTTLMMRVDTLERAVKAQKGSAQPDDRR
ncbi:MAG TPA: ABC transporter C-terminal domain-containing protein [Kofleriaceae bacterium]|jgi:peptidoglycan hydrolase CwlO-like protein